MAFWSPSMSSAARRTALTGIGLVTPLGLHTAATWEAVRAGRSGIRPIQSFDPSKLPVHFAGEVLDFDAKAFIDKKDRKQIKVMARGIQLAVAAAQIAMDDAKVDKTTLDPTRFGIDFGSGVLSTELKDLVAAAHVSSLPPAWEVDMAKWGSEGLGLIEPLWMLKYLPNFLASHISILHNAQGPNNSITQSNVSSLLALGEAHRILLRGQADFMLVGGAESKINPLGWTRNCQFAPMSKRNDAPEKASRPFDKDRDGVVFGEGGGVIVAEDLEHARKRGARIYGELAGFGSAFDARRDGRGIARAIRLALGQAGVTPDAIDHVNANGLSTPSGDRREAQALREVFGSRPVPVFAAKSYFGDVGAGSGVVELALGLLSQQSGTLPATLNYEHPDPACPVAVNRAPLAIQKPWLLKVGFNEMGQAAAAVVRRWEGQ
jgi:3-oxoacyl-[acyl-carrier-protein] synthase II